MPVETFTTLPDPGTARTLDELTERLRSLKVWAGDPSYEAITDRINTGWIADGRPPSELARRGTVVDCFKPGRRRLNTDLVLAVVRALHPDAGYVAQWRQALRVVLGETGAAAQVRVQDTLPAELPEFTGRTAELDRLQQALRCRKAGGAVVISAIEGMAGVGKTQLAVHAGHLLGRAVPFERVLFVNLRGFHPEPAQPPADPAAVLDSFLRLLGVPGQQIPHDLATRTALYRQRMAGKRALVVLDNAADEEQVAPLLPENPDCLTLVTSRRSLAGLQPATHLTVDVFTPDEALEFLTRAIPHVPVGDDPEALARVAQRCGHLPLALGLAAGQMRSTLEWTVTDHADRLDERHHNHRLDSGVEVALTLSYQHLPAERRQLFRLLALHPGHDLDGYAAAALINTDLPNAEEQLRQLCVEHLLQQPAPGRYAFHDLVRAYATDRARDEDRPPDRRAALTRLLDHYLYTAATAMDTLIPAERNRRPRVPQPATHTPPVAELSAARAWLDTERANLIAAAVHTHGWPEHTVRLAATLSRYLDTGGHLSDAVALHAHAARVARVARHSGGPGAEATALMNLGTVYGRLGRFGQAADHLQQALILCRQIGDRLGEARALGNLGTVYWSLSRYRRAVDQFQQTLTLVREIDDHVMEVRTLDNLGLVHWRLGRYREAVGYLEQALALSRDIGDRYGEPRALAGLGLVHQRLGHHQQATDHHQQALTLSRDIGDRDLEAHVLTGLGLVHQRLGHHQQATDHHRQALTLFREIGNRGAEADSLNSLGEALLADGQFDQARTQHSAALSLANQTGELYEQARAHNGLAHTHHATGGTDQARHHWQLALAVYANLDVPEADQVRTCLAALGNKPH
jgi:tetratricopeptide (TPR) repeat protein